MTKLEFEPRPMPRSPFYAGWFACGGILLVLLNRYLPWGGYAPMISLPISIVVLGGWLCVFVLRVSYYLCGRSNAHYHTKVVKWVEKDWQARNRDKAALVEAVLIGADYKTPEGGDISVGPARDTTGPKAAAGWITIEAADVLDVDAAERERQLAKLLALRWQAKPFSAQPLRCYWLGSFASWRAFVGQMNQGWPQIVFPEHPESWQGIDSLYAIIDQLQDAPDDACILCGGCHAFLPNTENRLSDGDAALLWLFGPQGRLLFSRGEWFGSDDEGPVSVTERAPQQSGQPAPAQICVSFAEPQFDIGWNREQRDKDACSDTLENLSDMVAMTLAAWNAECRRQPHGYRSTYTLSSQVLGVVKPSDSSTETPKPDLPVTS